MSNFEFKGKSVLVTGAGSGIGRSISQVFAGAGAFVVLAGRRTHELGETAGIIREAGGQSIAIATDVTDEDAMRSLMSRVERLNVAINAAGIVAREAIDTMEADVFARVFSVNVFGLWVSMKHEIEKMKGTGGGVIINIGSNVGARVIRPTLGAYAASKAAVSSLTQTAALEVIEYGIRVNCICPGPVDTPLSFRAGEDRAARDKRIAATNPSKRVASTDEIAAATLWLASDKASFIVGQDIVIDGGASV